MVKSCVTAGKKDDKEESNDKKKEEKKAKKEEKKAKKEEKHTKESIQAHKHATDQPNISKVYDTGAWWFRKWNKSKNPKKNSNAQSDTTEQQEEDRKDSTQTNATQNEEEEAADTSPNKTSIDSSATATSTAESEADNRDREVSQTSDNSTEKNSVVKVAADATTATPHGSISSADVPFLPRSKEIIPSNVKLSAFIVYKPTSAASTRTSTEQGRLSEWETQPKPVDRLVLANMESRQSYDVLPPSVKKKVDREKREEAAALEATNSKVKASKSNHSRG